MRLLSPMRFRLHEDDHERYGADWYVYDESALVRLPARELIAIEAEIGMSVLGMVDAARRPDAAGFTAATLAAMWVARRLSGVDERIADFAPMVLLAEWEPVSAGDADPPDQTPSTSPPGE